MSRTITHLFSVIALCAAGHALAGDLNPPAGPIAPTLKDLDGVEPRVAISDATTPGDADSVYRIDTPGSYYLTANVPGQPGKHGIEVAASGVTIDLMGFHLSATPGNGLSGVYTGFGAGLENVAVLNGTVAGWIDAIDLSGVNGGRVVGVHCVDAQNNGIVLGTSMVVRDCTAVDAAGSGFSDQGKCRYTDCVSRSNGFNGFQSSSDCSFHGCLAEANDMSGFTGSFGCSWSQCTARLNGQLGFSGNFACSIIGCLSSSNGSHGIYVASQCHVRDNDCTANGAATPDGAGINTNGIDNRIEGNNCVANDIGIDVVSSGNLIVRNAASGNTSGNYDLSITNTSSDPTTAGPWDNLTY